VVKQLKIPCVIVITGVDGAGKSTIARLLKRELLLRGYNVRIVWVKSLHTLAYLTYLLFSKVKGKEYVKNPCNKVVEHYVTTWMKKLGKVWLLIEFVSILPWILLKVEAPSKFRTIICDRYIPDFLATASLRIGEPLTPWKSLIGKFLRALQQKCEVTLLDINYRTVLKRRPDIEYTEEELKKLIVIYRVLAREQRAKVVNTATNGVKETLRQVVEYLVGSPNQMIE